MAVHRAPRGKKTNARRISVARLSRLDDETVNLNEDTRARERRANESAMARREGKRSSRRKSERPKAGGGGGGGS
jgi:hypothetical protein